MSTARMKRREDKKDEELGGKWYDGQIKRMFPLMTRRQSARRRPTWGWRQSGLWSVLGNPRPSDARPTLICSDDADNARWAEAAKPLLNDLNRQIARKLGTPPDSP